MPCRGAAVIALALMVSILDKFAHRRSAYQGPEPGASSHRNDTMDTMSHFDDLPRRDHSHDIEEKAVTAFQKQASDSDAFIIQTLDRKDYGTDCQLEVIDQGRVTNVRVHVQLKGTEK